METHGEGFGNVADKHAGGPMLSSAWVRISFGMPWFGRMLAGGDRVAGARDGWRGVPGSAASEGKRICWH